MITYSIRGHYSIVVSPHLKNVTNKNPLRFQDLLQTYTRQTTPASVPPPASVLGPAHASSETVTAQLLSNFTIDLLIALRKSKHTCTHHPFFNFVFYSHLLSFFRSFISFLDSCSVHKNVSEALYLSDWTQTMQKKMTILEQNETWELVTLPPGKKAVGRKQMYTVKLNSDESLARLKARLVAKGYS